MTTNLERVNAWHANKPHWTEKWSARDWDTADQVARKLDAEAAPEPEDCLEAPAGFYCLRQKGHEGACKVVPDDRPPA